jgi:hypothetical protein
VIACALAWAIVLLSTAAQAQTWTAPLGVPTPAFGVREQGPASPSSWTSERAGFYYVDNTHAAASDSYTYGTPARPRRSIPSGVAAGAVVEVHGGPYLTGANMSFGGNGTAASPIFYRGVGKPRIVGTANNRNVGIWGSYVVVEGFTFENMQVAFVGTFQAVRDSEMRGMPPAPGGSAVYVGVTKDIVILRNYIHNNGDPNYPTENDIHGVLVGTGAERVWIVDNEMHGNGGDSVQVNSGISTLAKMVFIARNRMHEEGENAVDIKTAEDVIISQNRCWGFRPTQYATSGSDGTAIVVNDDNARNGLNNRIFVLFNEVYGSTVGIRTQSYAYVVGNVIRQIDNAGILSYGPHDVHVEHNTFYAVGRAMDRFGGDATNKIAFVNNISSTRTWDDLKVTGGATSGSVTAYSLFPSPARILWSGATFNSLASFMGSHQCVGCREGSAQFLNAAGGDFRLGSGSPAVGSGIASNVYAAYQSAYGVSISFDFAGRARPGADGKWDMGAHESDGGGGAPAAPTNLRIIR